jgi:FkbM family methyltransferase
MLRIYAHLAGRLSFYKFNYILLRIALSGLGVLNYQDKKVSGETYFLNLLRKLKPGTILDVGANIGEYSLFCYDTFRNVSPGVQIYAFEPQPVTYGKLVKNVASVKNITCVELGVSDVAGTTLLYDYGQSGSEHASLSREVIRDLHHSQEVNTSEINLTTIDAFLETHQIEKVDLLKIDVEGYELNVLRGASASLEKGRIGIIQFEFNEMNVMNGYFLKNFRELLPGYDLYRLLPHGLLPLEDKAFFVREIFAFQNIIAISKNMDIRA